MRKLVRDKIPAEMQARGACPVYAIVPPSARLPLLVEKLHEEAAEIGAGPCAEELADAFEVLLSIARVAGIEWQDVARAAADKVRRKGSFANGIFMVACIEPRRAGGEGGQGGQGGGAAGAAGEEAD